jgi:hypothetical protein
MKIDAINKKCIEVGDCLEWQGYRNENGTPSTSGSGSVRRSVWRHYKGEIPKGKCVTVGECDNKLCLNIEHLRLASKREIVRRSGKQGLFSGVLRAQHISATRRQQSSHLTQERVDQIRACDQPAKVSAELHGVKLMHWYKIRAGAVWKDYSSPFAGLMRA